MDTDFKDIKKQYNELKALWGTEKSRNLSDEEALRYQDVLELLQERGYIMNLRVDGANLYTKRAEWDGFQDWLEQQIKTSLQSEPARMADCHCQRRDRRPSWADTHDHQSTDTIKESTPRRCPDGRKRKTV